MELRGAAHGGDVYEEWEETFRSLGHFDVLSSGSPFLKRDGVDEPVHKGRSKYWQKAAHAYTAEYRRNCLKDSVTLTNPAR